jgi:hypothetical protein
MLYLGQNRCSTDISLYSKKCDYMNTPLVVAVGTSCAISWLIAYFLIIVRTILDKTSAIPLLAVIANIVWEFIYGFILEPGSDYMHLLSVLWFLIDLIVIFFAVKYSRYAILTYLDEEVSYPWFIFFLVCSSFGLIYFSFINLSDPAGEYTGFGINLLMTYLFIDKYFRNKIIAGQSLYIAIFKFLGTFLAFIATCIEALTTVKPLEYVNFWQYFSEFIRFDTYPLTNLIKVLYLLVLIGDIFYIIMVYKLIQKNCSSVWMRL